MRSSSTALICLLAVTLARELKAQQRLCDDSDTIQECINHVNDRVSSPGGTPADAEASRKDQETELASKTAGTTALAPGLSSSINDFIPALAGALGFTPTTTGDGAAAFESNLRIPFGTALQKVRLQTVLREAEIYQPLRAALPEATREERVAALGRELGDFDDVRLSIAWNYESRSFGRTFEAYRGLYDTLFQLERTEFHQRPGVGKAKELVSSQANEAFSEVMRNISAQSLDPTQQGCEFEPTPAKLRLLQLRCLTLKVRAQLEEVIDRAARATQAVESELDDQLERTGFFDLPDLVNNQPQLTAQVNVDIRQDLAGPNEFSGNLRYEAGFANMNGLRRACQPDRAASITLDCLRGYARDSRRQASLKRGDRFFLALSYARRSDYDISLEDDAVMLDLEGTWDFTGELGFGRYVAFNRDGEQIGRIDLSAMYVHHRDDPDRENRFVGSATYTQRVNPSLSLAAGVSYASRPEFLEEVERKVTANFGLRYKLIQE